jgi:divalent metal cation (Fe/Co/Zn/Cd) transporter
MNAQAPSLIIIEPGGGTRSRLVRRAKLLSWLSLVWMTIEGAVGVIAGLVAGSVALTGFGLDSVIEGTASVIVIWRFTGGPESSENAERRAQQLVGMSFFLLAPYIAFDAILTLTNRSHAMTSWVGVMLAIASIALMPLLGRAKASLGAQLGSSRERAHRTCFAHTWPQACSPGYSPTPSLAGGGLTR